MTDKSEIGKFIDELQDGFLKPRNDRSIQSHRGKLIESANQYSDFLKKASKGDESAKTALPKIAQKYISEAWDFFQITLTISRFSGT